MSEHAAPRQPTCALHLTKSAAIGCLQKAVQDAHNRTEIAELGFLRRGLYYLRNDWDDKFGHGYMLALQETLRDTERDEFRRKLWYRITNRAILVTRLQTMDSAATDLEIQEIIADLDRLS